MTGALPTQQPGRETAAAFAFVPSREFDGGLVSRVIYTLTRADALAYLRLKRRWSKPEKWLLGIWFVLGGAASAFLPSSIGGSVDSPRSVQGLLLVIALQFALLLSGRAMWRQYRAKQMVPVPRRAEFEEWIDCVAGTEIESDDCAYLSPELIGEVIETPTHIFILSFNARIVVPKRAFSSAEEANRMASHLRDLSAGPYYFDA